MPIYLYRCSICRQQCELLVRSTTEPACPSCGSHALARLPALTAAPGKSAAVLGQARTQAAREGHFSHYRPSERPRIRK